MRVKEADRICSFQSKQEKKEVLSSGNRNSIKIKRKIFIKSTNNVVLVV